MIFGKVKIRVTHSQSQEETSSTSTYDYGFRIYSPSLGRFLSVDPLIQKYPELTPYQFASNTPIQAIDLDGAESMFGWSVGLTPEQTAETVDSWNKHNTQIVDGTAAGIKKSVIKTWSFITKDAWKTNTWKEFGTFLGEIPMSMSTVPIVATPRVDAVGDNFINNLVNGDGYTRSEYFAELGTDALLAKGMSEAFTVLKGMGLAEKIATRTNFASSFYENVGGDVRDIGGINLTKKVSAINLNSNTKLYQWTIDGKLGDYFSPKKDAKNLGLPQMSDGTPAYFDKTTNSLKPRTLVEVELPVGKHLKGLKSTAADIKPWDGSSGMNTGGDIQIYSPEVKAANPTIRQIQ